MTLHMLKIQKVHITFIQTVIHIGSKANISWRIEFLGEPYLQKHNGT